MKKVQKDELANVTGGRYDKGRDIVCPNCGHTYNIYDTEHKTVAIGEGCSGDEYEYKCPNCGTWNK